MNASVKSPFPVVYVVQKIGAYHDARLRAWAGRRGGGIRVIEFRPGDREYAWTRIVGSEGYERTQVDDRRELVRALEEASPRAVVCVGYADAAIQAAVNWALRRRIPLVTCSDSNQGDERRHGWKELGKRAVVGAFDAGLVAGRRSRAYLENLGLPPASLFQPWDVVDNTHFQSAARRSGGRESVAGGTGIESAYFLCVSRFIAKKNLPVLLTAYAGYLRRAPGASGWPLVLAGTGPQESSLRSLAHDLGLVDQVRFLGLVAYDDLPSCYASAGALVLPSSRDQWGLVVNEAMAAGLPVLVSRGCGCVEDLVQTGENGFTFDPAKPNELTEALARVAELSREERVRMGERSQEIIAAYSPAAFAAGVEAAVAHAVARPRRWRPVSIQLTRLLSRRSFAVS